MDDKRLPTPSRWGYQVACRTPVELVAAVEEATRKAIERRIAWPEDIELCLDAPGYSRTSVAIPLSAPLANELMNSRNGYRAHYAVGAATGEEFNRALVEAIAPLFVEAEALYADRMTSGFCRKSLFGPHSKLWYPKELTDPSAQGGLLELKAEIRVSEWVEYWRGKPRPHKGLLAPVSEEGFVLLNGTFVNESGVPFDQKPERSKQIAESGWT